MPSVKSISSVSVWPSSTIVAPLEPTRLKHDAIVRPMPSDPVAIVATYLPYVRARHAGKNPADGARGLALVASASAAVAGVAGAATGYLHVAVAVAVSAAAATPRSSVTSEYHIDFAQKK